MITHLQETWKIQNKVMNSYIEFHYIYNYFFWVGKLRFLIGVSISNSQKLIEWIYREVEGYSRPEKHCQHNEDLYSFHTMIRYKFCSGSHRL